MIWPGTSLQRDAAAYIGLVHEDSPWPEAWLITFSLAVLGTLAVIVIGRKLTRPWLTLVVALAMLSVVWVLGYGLTQAGWNDVDGWADCSDCGGWHVLGAFLFLGPPVIGLVLVIGVLIAAVVDRLADRTTPHSRAS
jgi:hypothetical protein